MCDRKQPAVAAAVWAPESLPHLCFSFSAFVRAEGDGRRVRRFDVEIPDGEGPDGSGKQGPFQPLGNLPVFP